MWKYRRRLSLHPRESMISFGGERLRVAADGRILSPIDAKLELKMRKSPHSFMFDSALVMKVEEPEMKASAPEISPEPQADSEPVQVEKVEVSSEKDDNVPKRKRRPRKSTED